MPAPFNFTDDQPEPAAPLAQTAPETGNGALPLERAGMAWPPGRWEASPSAWRPDVVMGPGPFTPYGGGEAVLEAPVPGVESSRGAGTLVREFVETIFLALVIFVGIRLVVQNFKIEGSSMEPTLHSGQYLLVNKLAYRSSGESQRGDIVVFESWNSGKDFIKRVVGVPGETVEVRDSSVWINGERLDEGYLDQITSGNVPPIVLGEDEYFVMGDNRGNSSDSRNHGALKRDKIIGKAWMTYWPPDQMGMIPDSRASFAATP